jgi:hypothetical protein
MNNRYRIEHGHIYEYENNAYIHIGTVLQLQYATKMSNKEMNAALKQMMHQKCDDNNKADLEMLADLKEERLRLEEFYD